jgi:hypothetical protein
MAQLKKAERTANGTFARKGQGQGGGLTGSALSQITAAMVKGQGMPGSTPQEAMSHKAPPLPSSIPTQVPAGPGRAYGVRDTMADAISRTAKITRGRPKKKQRGKKAPRIM